MFEIEFKEFVDLYDKETLIAYVDVTEHIKQFFDDVEKAYLELGEYDPESCGAKENWKHFAKNHWKTDDIVNDRGVKFDECVFIKFKSGKQTIISTFDCCDIIDAKNTVFKNIFDL